MSLCALKALSPWPLESNIVYHDIIFLPSYRKILTAFFFLQRQLSHVFCASASCMAAAIHTFSWEAPASPETMLQPVPFISFSSSEFLCSLMIAHVPPFEGRLEMERLANMFLLKR